MIHAIIVLSKPTERTPSRVNANVNYVPTEGPRIRPLCQDAESGDGRGEGDGVCTFNFAMNLNRAKMQSYLFKNPSINYL